MEKQILKIQPAVSLDTFEPYFAILDAAGVGEASAIFGGAIRDTYYAAHWGNVPRVNDYDVRVWLPDDEYAGREAEFAQRLGEAAGYPVEHKLSAGTNRVRYYVTMNDAELDVSVRPKAAADISGDAIAIDRAGDADAGLSSVALARNGNLWATPEFVQDIENKTISLYPRPENTVRLGAYAARMGQKFSDHDLVWL